MRVIAVYQKAIRSNQRFSTVRIWRDTMFLKLLAATALLGAATLYAAPKSNVTPGARTLVLAHNAYPDHGKYSDRVDRAIASGTPFVIEEDLAWVDGHSLICHGAKNSTPGDPTLESYLMPKLKPIMEKALREGNKGNWPLVTLYLDIKNDPPEHLAYINQVLDRYNAWLSTAVKTDDLAKQSPLKAGPLMVLVEDKTNDIKQRFFYDDVPVGGNIRVFGSYTKLIENPDHLPKQQFIDSLSAVPIDTVTRQRADNYHRWWGVDWAYVEKGGEEHHGEWQGSQEDRLRNIVEYGHNLGYLMGVYCLDGFTAAENQGWEDEYNFGSLETAKVRWQAARAQGVDFISTDQYEALADVLRHPLPVSTKSTPENLPTASLISKPGPSLKVAESELSAQPTVVIYGDQRFTDPANTKVTNPTVRRALVEQIAKRRPDAVLMNGDVPYSGDVVNDYDVFRSETTVWRDEKLHIYPALGNHEFHGDPQQALDHWWSAFPELHGRRWYSVELGRSIYTISLDSDTSLLPGSVQQRWLDDQLKHLPASTRFVFLSLHHPPVADFQTRTNVSHNPRPNEIALRDYLTAIAPTLKARIIVSAGHIHNYERFERQGVVYFISGGGAASPVPVDRASDDRYQDSRFPNYHYVEFSLVDGALHGKMYRVVDANATPITYEVSDTFVLTPPTAK